MITAVYHANRPRTQYVGNSPEAVRETVLLDRCKSGNTDAWELLLSRYRQRAYLFAFSLCRNADEADEVVALALARVYCNLQTFRNESSFTSWLFRIVRNTYLDICVRPTYKNHVSLDAGFGNNESPIATRDVPDPTPSPEAVCMAKETARLLSDAIQYLPAYQRQVLQMYHSENKSYEEIAEATGLSIGTVKSRLNRARKNLAARLAPFRERLTAA